MFAELDIWLLMLCALIVERIGAINIQAHSLSNRVDWHYANGGYAVLFVSMLFLFGSEVGLIAIPVCSLAAYLLWYYPFSFHRAYSVLPELRITGDLFALFSLIILATFSFYSLF